MKPFRFRLEALLEFRKRHKEQSQIAFLEATSQLDSEKRILTELEVKLAENSVFIQTRQQQSLPIEIFKSFRYYFDKISGDIVKQNHVLYTQMSIACNVCKLSRRRRKITKL